MKALVLALVEGVFLLAVAPLLLAAELACLSIADLAALLVPKKLPAAEPAERRAFSVVIPTWNGKHHLAANLPSVVAALKPYPDSEILVVDNASQDGTVEFLNARFPHVRVLGQQRNLGFGGGSNAGFRAAQNDIVVLLNNDMRVEPDFVAPLLAGFADDRQVFAVTAQIFFSDPSKRREETGLTVGRWTEGRLRLGHIIDPEIAEPFPTFYAGGGSSAYDRRKFLELGGFDALLAPFYMEDADVSYMAWKRGWKVLYAPRSIVYHEHRGTIGRSFSESYIERTIQQNNLLFVWKNIHEPTRLATHFLWTWAALWTRLIAGPSPTRPDSGALLRALARTPAACAARFRARRLATIGDDEALRRPWPGYYRDRFADLEPDPATPNVLFVSPYSMEPPVHGGAVFMNQTVRRLAEMVRLHLFVLVDEPGELESNRGLEASSESLELRRRRKNPESSNPILPHAAQEFWDSEVLWRLHRSIYLNRIDAVQLEYTQLAVYAFDFERIATFLFEHDVYFQSVRSSIRLVSSAKLKQLYAYEYLRALRFERRAVRRFDAVQVCTAANRSYLESFAWRSAPVYEGFRAGIDVGRYRFAGNGREPDTLLFVGNFKHPPNRVALEFFIREVFPAVRRRRPRTRLIAVGAQAPPDLEETIRGPGVEFLGEVDDIREALGRYSVFLAPILSGSGVRVKLLEAFAAGIPVVSTRLGAEGLAEQSGEIVELADSPEDFAAGVLALLEDPAAAAALALRARQAVEQSWDINVITARLAEHYGQVIRRKRSDHS